MQAINPAMDDYSIAESTTTVAQMKIEDELEMFYNNELGVTHEIWNQSTTFPSTFAQQIADLKIRSRMPLNCNVFQVWGDLKTHQPDMHKLATAMLAVPCSQASVQAAVTALAQILPIRRKALKAENLQNLLWIKLNFELF